MQAVYIRDEQGLHPVELSDRASRDEVVRAPRIVETRAAPRRRAADAWEKEVLIVGGSAGAGTAIGALAGGKKGAAVGAAVAASADHLRPRHEEQEMTGIRRTVVLAMGLALAGVGLRGGGSVPALRVSDQQLRDLATRIAADRDRFHDSLGAAIDRSPINGSSAEDQINRAVESFKQATDLLRDRVNDRQADIADAENVLRRASVIDDLMARNRLDTSSHAEWQALRRDMDELARAYAITSELERGLTEHDVPGGRQTGRAAADADWDQGQPVRQEPRPALRSDQTDARRVKDEVRNPWRTSGRPPIGCAIASMAANPPRSTSRRC